MKHTGPYARLRVGEMRGQHIDINHLNKDEKGAISLTIAKVTARQSWLAESEANARRLVACWNALESLDTEQIEDDAFTKMRDDRTRLLADNARLREALQRILIASDRRMADGGEKLDYQDTNRQAGDVARAALKEGGGVSKAKGFRNRRVRRQENAALKFGRSAKPRHRLRSGRTGKSMSTKLKSGLRGKGKSQ